MKPSNPAGEITYSIDDDQMVWIEASWTNNQQSVESFALLLHQMHSGELLEDTLRFLKSECAKEGSQNVYKKILITMDKMFAIDDDALAKVASSNDSKEIPVVSPTEIALNYLSMF
jgi:hypothetical protein